MKYMKLAVYGQGRVFFYIAPFSYKYYLILTIYLLFTKQNLTESIDIQPSRGL